jgi:hypothetical protein
MQNYKVNGYATHQPLLSEVIKNTTGNILECGCGEGSTRYIQELIKNSSRKLYSLESDFEYYNKYNHENCHYINAGNYDTIETGNKWVQYIQNCFSDLEFDVVFIDQSPWLSRKCVLDYFINKAKYIIIHDADYFPVNNIFGKVNSKEKINEKIIYNCSFDDVSRNYFYYTPPLQYFFGNTGPPTLLLRGRNNLIEDSEWEKYTSTLAKKIESYY